MKEAETLHANNTQGKENPSHFHQVVPFNWLKPYKKAIFNLHSKYVLGDSG